MTQQTIPVNDGRIDSHVGSTPSTGPFAVDFPFFSLNDVVVFYVPDGRDDETGRVYLVRGPDYSLAGVSTDDGSFSSGTVTLVLAISNATISRVRQTPIERLSNFPLQGFFSRLALNAELNKTTVWLQDSDRQAHSLSQEIDDIREDIAVIEAGTGDGLGYLSILGFHAVGDGIADDTAAVLAALATGRSTGMRITGDGRTYAVTGNIFLPDGTWLQDAKFKQLAPESAGRRTLTNDANTAIGITLIRVSINRNGTPSSISTITDSAGIWLSGNANKTASLWLEDCEVYGDGAGQGIQLSRWDEVTMIRPHVHDMAWYQATDPGSGGEKIVGLAIFNINKLDIDNPQIHRLMGWWGTPAASMSPLRAYETDGIGIAGCDGTTVRGGRITFVGEGFDGSGSTLSRNTWFIGTVFEDCFVGYKQNAHRDSGAVGCTFIRCGLWGAVVGTNNVSSMEYNATKNLRYIGCSAVDVGAPHSPGAAGLSAGYRLDWTAGAPPDARTADDVVYDNCSAIGNTATATGSIAGTLLTVTAIAEGAVVTGQNIAGAGVTAGTYIVGPGQQASIVGNILGNNNLTVVATHYGAVAVGQKVYGPGIPDNITILSGSGANWVLSNNPVTAPLPNISGLAMLLSEPGTGNYTGIYTVTPAQTVASTTLSMTSNMTMGFQLSATELNGRVTINNASVSGVTEDFHNYTSRISSWRSDNTNMIYGGVLVPEATASFLPSTTRFSQYLATGPIARRDDNALAQLGKMQNFGLTGTNQGAQWIIELGTANLFEANGATLEVVTTGTWGAVAANRSAKMRFRVAGAGSLVTVLELNSTQMSVTVPLIFSGSNSYPTSLADAAVGAGANSQAFIKASSTANLGIFYGTGDPTFSAAKGSLYTKTDATTTTSRLWVNTNGSTGWTFFTSNA